MVLPIETKQAGTTPGRYDQWVILYLNIEFDLEFHGA